MAKGNLFLGQARGKVGDVVFYRAGGQQLTRARNRSPRNPKSLRQTVQRSVAASVQRLYSLGQELFNHSHQGVAPGMDNQREFVSRNMSILRGLLIDELNAATADADCVARIGAPGINIGVPFVGAQVSSGTYSQMLFAWDAAAYAYKLPAAASQETLGTYAARVGLYPGDIYTLGSIACDPSVQTPAVSAGDTAYGKLYRNYFAYVQLKVKDDVVGSSSPMAGALFGTLFEVVGGSTLLRQQDITEPVDLDALGAFASEQGCLFCIRSRWGDDLRSTSYLMPGRAAQSFGLTANYLEAAWSAQSSLDQQELVLEGKDF